MSIHGNSSVDAGLRAKLRLMHVSKRQFADIVVLRGRRIRAWVRFALACKLTILLVVAVVGVVAETF